jgi:hypothetical protein
MKYNHSHDRNRSSPVRDSTISRRGRVHVRGIHGHDSMQGSDGHARRRDSRGSDRMRGRRDRENYV